MNTTLIITGALIFALTALYLIARSKIKNTPVVENNENIIVLTDKNFQHQIKDRLILVDYWAEWCMPCRMMAPVLNDLAEELKGTVFIGKVDVEQNQDLARKSSIRNIPTLVLYKNGKEINRYVGIKTKDFLMKEIKKA